MLKEIQADRRTNSRKRRIHHAMEENVEQLNNAQEIEVEEIINEVQELPLQDIQEIRPVQVPNLFTSLFKQSSF